MLFGDKNNFAIEYEFIHNPYYEDEYGLIRDSWGSLKIWINSANTCKLERQVEENKVELETYEWNLCYVVGWFCNNLWHIYLDEFPFKSYGNCTVELYENQTDELVIEITEDDPEDMNFLWHDRHCLFMAYDGSYLPLMYFRRVGNDIEINWDNEGHSEEDCRFLNLEGLVYIQKEIFLEVVVAFVKSFIQLFKDRCPEEIAECSEALRHSLERIKQESSC